MAQINGLVRERTTFLGIESTCGTASGTLTPAVMLGTDLAVDGLAYEMLDNLDERSRRLEAQPKVIGLPIGSKLPALEQYLQTVPVASQLLQPGGSGAVTALSTRKLLLAGYGAEHVSLGSTADGAVTAGATTMDVNNSNFAAGTWVAWESTNAAGIEFGKVVQSGGTLHFQTPVLANVNNNAVIKNLYSFAPAESHTTTLTVQRAFTADPTAQYEVVGVHGTAGWNFPEFGKLATLKMDLAALGFEGPNSQSIATTSQTNDMGVPFKFAPAMYLAPYSAPGVTTLDLAVPFVFESIEVAFTNTFEMVRDGGAFATFTDASTQQTTVKAVVNTAGRPVAGTVTVKARFDGNASTGYDARFNDETDFQMVLVQRIGTGINATIWLWEFPLVRLAAKPKLTAVGSRMYSTLMFEMRQDEAISGGTTDFQLAPFRVAFG